MTEPLKITQKITGYRVKKEEETIEKVAETEIKKQVMNEFVEREPVLTGRTFKLKATSGKHSLYITLNAQEVDGILYPREIFFNTKNPNHKMWMDALALTISAVFRKGNDVKFIVDEFKTVYDTEGYWGKDHVTGKGKYYKSIIEEIGYVIGIYLNDLADINRCNVEEPKKHVVALKDAIVPSEGESTIVECKKEYANAKQCPDCNNISVVKLDGCDTCLECGYSKCG